MDMFDKWANHLSPGAKTLKIDGKKAVGILDLLESSSETYGKEEKTLLKSIQEAKKQTKDWDKVLGESFLTQFMLEDIRISDAKTAILVVRVLSGREGDKGLLQKLDEHPSVRLAMLSAASKSLNFK